jgi:hypothetical protein
VVSRRFGKYSLVPHNLTFFCLDETIVDVLDESSIISSGLSFEIVYQGPKLFTFNFKPNIEGGWVMIPVTSGQYSTEVLFLYVQLNEYLTDPIFPQFFQSSTTVCLIIHMFL